MAQVAVPTWLAQMQAGHAKLISENPIALTFVRRQRMRLGTHFQEVPPENLGTFTVRVHQRGAGSSQVSDRNTGWQERDTTWGCLMPAEVPFRVTDGEDGNVRVEVIHPVHGYFRLRRLRALEAGGTRWGWQSDLERVSGTWDLEDAYIAAMADGAVAVPPYAGRPTLQDDPAWVTLMQDIDAYIVAHPGLTARAAMQAMGKTVPPERTVQAWRQRWKALQAQETQTMQQSVDPAPGATGP